MHPTELQSIQQVALGVGWLAAFSLLPLFGPKWSLNAYDRARFAWSRYLGRRRAFGVLATAVARTAWLFLLIGAMAYLLMPLAIGTWFRPSVAMLPYALMLTAGCWYAWDCRPERNLPDVR